VLLDLHIPSMNDFAAKAYLAKNHCAIADANGTNGQ
jgi:hypothetical protein